MPQSKGLFAVIGAAVAGMLLSILIHSNFSAPRVYSDIAGFWSRGWIVYGLFPNSSAQTFFEYPPISGFIVYLARSLGGSYDGYYSVISLLSVFAAIGIAWSSWRLAKAIGNRLHPLYFLMPGMIIYGLYSFDLFHTLFIMLSIQTFVEGRRGLSAMSLGLAISTKLVGGVLLPLFLLETKGGRERGRYFAIVAAVVALFYVPVELINVNYAFQFVDFFRNWGLEDAWYVWIFQDPSTWGYAKIFGLAVMVILLVRVYTLKMPVVSKAFLALSAYLLGTYIYAPQFNVMLIPLVAVLAIEHPSVYLWDVFNAMIILTWFSSALSLPDPTRAWTLPQEFSLLRAVMLAWMMSLILRQGGWHLSSLLPRRGREAPSVQPAGNAGLTIDLGTQETKRRPWLSVPITASLATRDSAPT